MSNTCTGLSLSVLRSLILRFIIENKHNFAVLLTGFWILIRLVDMCYVAFHCHITLLGEACDFRMIAMLDLIAIIFLHEPLTSKNAMDHLTAIIFLDGLLTSRYAMYHLTAIIFSNTATHMKLTQT